MSERCRRHALTYCEECHGAARVVTAQPLSADEIKALRFCVETADNCIRRHQSSTYAAAVGKLARAYDILARVPVEGER